MKVHWTNTALDQMQSIHDYIACNSPYYAKRMVDRITRRSIQISQFPLSGRKVPEYDFVDRSCGHHRLWSLTCIYPCKSSPRICANKLGS